MKKISRILIATLLITLLVAGCGDKSGGKDTSLQDVKDKKTFTLGLDPSFPPMGYTDDDQNLVGFDIDVAKEVCKRMGVELKLKAIDWSAKEQELGTKSIDCIWNGFTKTKERENALTLSDTYMLNEQVVVVLKKSNINSLADLKGKTITLQSASSAEDALNNEENKAFKDSVGNVISVKDNVQALMNLGIEGSDAVVMDKVVAMYYTEKEKDKFKILDEQLAKEEYVVGFRKGDQKLCDEVNKYMKEMASDGSLAKISQKWFGEDITTVSK